MKVQKQHMNTATYAPDLVKWTKRDYAKLLKEKKEENWKMEKKIL